MKYRLENLNQVQYADDEARRKELEAKGFHVVSVEADKKQETGMSGSTDISESFEEAGLPAEKPVEIVKAGKKKASKGSRKSAAEEDAEDAGTDREPAGGEDQDAG